MFPTQKISIVIGGPGDKAKTWVRQSVRREAVDWIRSLNNAVGRENDLAGRVLGVPNAARMDDMAVMVVPQPTSALGVVLVCAEDPFGLPGFTSRGNDWIKETRQLIAATFLYDTEEIGFLRRFDP